mmetsp:Transcript_49969/g.116764  ORF Transcript_49969/g.116764 Transcript_49969/m.116764 type:complete len:108 (+) Transcript_49969:70-393(+)
MHCGDLLTLRYSSDELLEDESFEPVLKRHFYMMKISMLSGRYTLVAATREESVSSVISEARRRLRLEPGSVKPKLLQGAMEIPGDTQICELKDLKPPGEVTELQLIL